MRDPREYLESVRSFLLDEDIFSFAASGEWEGEIRFYVRRVSASGNR